MQKSQIKPGADYGFRQNTRASGSPLQHVRVLEHARGNKWKAEWVDPNPGLVDYVESRQLLCLWKQHSAFLKEEENRERLTKYNEERGYREESPVSSALDDVFASVGGEVTYWNGVLSGAPEAIDRLRVRAGMETGNNPPYAYLDRSGTQHLPFDEAIAIAQKFCAAEPSTVLARIEVMEREWARDARAPGKEYILSHLADARAAWALVRQWTGHDPAVAEREKTIQMLERLVWDAIYALQKAGLDKEAARLRRAIERH